MLSYLHEFHAGNHADILKHLVLVYILEHLNAKKKPYTFFDTHAGSGLYDFNDGRALKTGECGRGIQKLLLETEHNPGLVPEGLKSYLAVVKKYTDGGRYPGSPLIESELLSDGSSHIISELHNSEYELLKNNMHGRNTSVHHRDGWEMLKALTPPAIKRGAVLCDPSYEELSDYDNAVRTLCEVHKKWNGATLALWYPLLSYRKDVIVSMKAETADYVRKINSKTEIVDIQLCVAGENAHIETDLRSSAGSEKPRLYGSGMFVVNPPWKMQEKLETVVPYLESVLGEQL